MSPRVQRVKPVMIIFRMQRSAVLCTRQPTVGSTKSQICYYSAGPESTQKTTAGLHHCIERAAPRVRWAEMIFLHTGWPRGHWEYWTINPVHSACFCRKYEFACPFSVISWHYNCYNTMTADNLVVQGSRVSAATVLISSPRLSLPLDHNRNLPCSSTIMYMQIWNSLDRSLVVCVTQNELCLVLTFQDTVEVLLKFQADINARDKNWQTPLHVAAANNAVKCAEFLIPVLTNVNVSDRAGRTSLHHAAFNGHLEVRESSGE